MGMGLDVLRPGRWDKGQILPQSLEHPEGLPSRPSLSQDGALPEHRSLLCPLCKDSASACRRLGSLPAICTAEGIYPFLQQCRLLPVHPLSPSTRCGK